MDHHNNLNREVTLSGKTWKIVAVSDDGMLYALCDVYGREITMPVKEVISRASRLA